MVTIYLEESSQLGHKSGNDTLRVALMVPRLITLFLFFALLIGCLDTIILQPSEGSTAKAPVSSAFSYTVMPEQKCPAQLQNRKLKSSAVLHPSARVCYY